MKHSFWKLAAAGVGLVFGGSVAYFVFRKEKKIEDKLDKGIPVNFPQMTQLQQDVEPLANQAVKVANQVLAHPTVTSSPTPHPAGDLARQAIDLANQAARSAQDPQNQANAVSLANQAAQAAQRASGLLFGN